MKFSTFVRQANTIIKRIKKIKSLIEDLVLVLNQSLDEDKLGELGLYKAEAICKYGDFEQSVKHLLSHDKIDDFNDNILSDLEDEITGLFVSIQVLTKPFTSRLNNSDVSNSNTNVPACNRTHGSNLKLPTLSLQTFNGSPDQWLSFSGLFEISVDKNPNLSNIEKLQYLLTSLLGEPLALVRNLPITSQNYDIAWDILKQRYQNNRKIISLHINNLIDLPHVFNFTAKGLRQFISSYHENVQALLALEHDVSKDNIILASLLLRKLDSETRKKFEDGRTDSKSTPDSKEIISFLESECSHLEAASFTHTKTGYMSKHPSKQNDKPKQISSVLLLPPQQSVSCTFCDKTDHTIYKCGSFQGLSTQDKFEFVKRKRFCMNCLGSSHDVKN